MTLYTPHNLRAELHAHAGLIVAAFDNHDATINNQGGYHCPCGWTGTPQDWNHHVMDQIADVLAPIQGALL